MVEIVNIHQTKKYDIYIGRGSDWGNPFTVKEYGRERAIELYRWHLWQRIKSNSLSIEQLLSLDGKILGCFCKPLPCHGDILINAVEWAKNE